MVRLGPGTYVIWLGRSVVHTVLGMTTSIASTASTTAPTSRFARNRAVWTLLGIAALFVPLLWPVGGYILWKVFSTRDSTPSDSTAPRTDDGWE